MIRKETSQLDTPIGIQLNGEIELHHHFILSNEALDFLLALHERFNQRRKQLLDARLQGPSLSESTASLSISTDKTSEVATKVSDYRAILRLAPVELSNLDGQSQISHVLIDFNLLSDWTRSISCQVNLNQFITSVSTEKSIIIAPRPLDQEEPFVIIHDRKASASLIDFGLFFFHNAHEVHRRDHAPQFYFTDIKNESEAQFWNDIFAFSQSYLGMRPGSIQAITEVASLEAAINLQEIILAFSGHLSGIAINDLRFLTDQQVHFKGKAKKILPNANQLPLRGLLHPYLSDYGINMAHRYGVCALYFGNELTKTGVLTRIEAGYDGEINSHQEVIDKLLSDYPSESQRLNERRDVLPSVQKLFQVPIGTITEQGLSDAVNLSRQVNELGELAQAQVANWVECEAKTVSGVIITEDLVQSIKSQL